MTREQRIQQALAYFSDESHPQSFALLPGTGQVMLSAPHAVLQTRNGAPKPAERYTGMLCKLLHEDAGCPVLYKTRHLQDDANHDPQSDYREAACLYVRQHAIRCFLDLHQLAPQRSMDLCIGTGKGANLQSRDDLPLLVKEVFQAHGIRRITLDDPFAAKSPHTVSATVAACCGIPTLQLELNTRLLQNDNPECCFEKVWDALRQLVIRLNQG